MIKPQHITYTSCSLRWSYLHDTNKMEVNTKTKLLSKQLQTAINLIVQIHKT